MKNKKPAFPCGLTTASTAFSAYHESRKTCQLRATCRMPVLIGWWRRERERGWKDEERRGEMRRETRRDETRERRDERGDTRETRRDQERGERRGERRGESCARPRRRCCPTSRTALSQGRLTCGPRFRSTSRHHQLGSSLVNRSACPPAAAGCSAAGGAAAAKPVLGRCKPAPPSRTWCCQFLDASYQHMLKRLLPGCTYK